MRTVNGIPEGGCFVSELHRYKVYDCPDSAERLGEGVTREWVILYSDKKTFWKDQVFIVHALTKEGAFSHFISIKPETFVKALEYRGIYF